MVGFFDFFKGKSTRTDETASQERTAQTLQVGDVVNYNLTDYTVDSKTVYNEDGYEWTSYMLRDVDQTIWLSVEFDDVLEVGIYEEIDLRLPDQIPDSINYDDETYYLQEHGHASANRVGGDGPSRSSRVEYWDFEADSGHMLSVERWSSETEVFRGTSIREHDLDIYPAP